MTKPASRTEFLTVPSKLAACTAITTGRARAPLKPVRAQRVQIDHGVMSADEIADEPPSDARKREPYMAVAKRIDHSRIRG